ncbi:photosystem II assembly protein Psb34 [Chlorogloeopsis sp. ULAP02]|uniref:photosystem II assembly protein Psb34 n=1 Tax=Chlorogloeopsis sp. ULAP02 TaxID=3107926 RepID=UPI0031357417
MYTTTDERGILNNYANEPKMYCAAYPSVEQQRRYTIQAGVAAFFVTALVVVAFVVS